MASCFIQLQLRRIQKERNCLEFDKYQYMTEYNMSKNGDLVCIIRQ